ncbi:MAG TPA: hypothetical protein VK171_03795 [Fimbriimonas sp.]|nr:hypothetical protein [Fimbriimonas sp.]
MKPLYTQTIEPSKTRGGMWILIGFSVLAIVGGTWDGISHGNTFGLVFSLLVGGSLLAAGVFGLNRKIYVTLYESHIEIQTFSKKTIPLSEITKLVKLPTDNGFRILIFCGPYRVHSFGDGLSNEKLFGLLQSQVEKTTTTT